MNLTGADRVRSSNVDTMRASSTAAGTGGALADLMGRDIDSERASYREEEPIAKAARLTDTLGDLLARAERGASIQDRGQLRYLEALVRTLGDGLGALKERRSS